MSKIALVTGASRGLGRGIARAIGAAGWIVYITARSEASLAQAAAEIEALGGTAIAVRCDHGNDQEIAALMEKIRAEQGGLDLLVNNAAAVYGAELTRKEPFWECSLALADMINVGLRSSYVAAYYAAPLMIDRVGSLIVNISFYGAVTYFHGPSYGAAKAGTDKMSYDMGVDFASTQTSVVSFWPGYILTDELRHLPAEHISAELAAMLPEFETPEFSGRAILALYADPNKAARSGQALIGAKIAREYGVTDEGGKDRRIYSAQQGRPISYPYGLEGLG